MLLAKLSEGTQSPCFWQNLIIDSTAYNSNTAIHSAGPSVPSTLMVTNTIGLHSFDSIKEVAAATFEVFPTPTSGLVNINYSYPTIAGGLTLNIFNLSSQLIFSKTYFSSNIKDNIDLGEGAAGVYFFEVSDGERKDVRKVVVY